MKKAIVLTFVLAITGLINAQELTQTIKGRVTDADSETGLPGTVVVIMKSDPVKGTTTDPDGYFRIEDVPVGRVSL